VNRRPPPAAVATRQSPLSAGPGWLAPPAPPTISDRYTLFLVLGLFGYAMLGRGFAYAGSHPVFVGEIILVCGVLVFLRTGTLFASVSTGTSLLIAAFMGWVLVRTLPFVGEHGIQALRDSVIAMYGAFAFIVIGLLIESPRRLNLVIDWFRRFSTVFVFGMPVLYVLFALFKDILPTWPGTDITLVSLRSGEVSVHLSAIAVFALLGFRRASWPWLLMLLAGMLLVFTQSRGGTLAILIPLMAAAVGAGRLRQLVGLVTLGGLLLAAAYALDLGIEVPGALRQMDVRQFVDNFASIFGASGDAALDGTKTFRMRWWTDIVDYTINGPYFWTGKGFGLNLAIADGYLVGLEHGGTPLRSPHNAHMTVLARAGVPGLVLWALLIASWYGMLVRDGLHARARGEHWWARFFLFVGCYVAAILIDASFDVALEGPMIGIWFWVLIGLGIGATMIYRRSVMATGPARPSTDGWPGGLHGGMAAIVALAVLGLPYMQPPAMAAIAPLVLSADGGF